MDESSRAKAYAALAAVYFFWGTTYLAIRVALESFPPLFLVGTRFVISGAIMAVWVAARRERWPRGRDLVVAGASGLLILGIGNGALVLAEQIIPSGIASLFITLSPFWMVGMEALLPGGVPLHPPTLLGMAVGLAGVALLIAPGAGGADLTRNMLIGFLMLQAGSASWSLGSIFQRRQTSGINPIVNATVHQLVTGVLFSLIAAAANEPAPVWNPHGIASLLYLVTFGSIVGYTAFVYALDKLPVAIVSTYPYVNSVVAVSLGWLVYREHFGLREAAAMAIIFAGVAIVKRTTKH